MAKSQKVLRAKPLLLKCNHNANIWQTFLLKPISLEYGTFVNEGEFSSTGTGLFQYSVSVNVNFSDLI